MHISWKFTGDGLLAFAGGTLALIGVWLSNRQSVKNLQKQLDTEKKAQAEKAENYKRALATAILYEIDHFYRYDLSISTQFAKGVRGKELNAKVGLAIPVETGAFDVYHEKAGDIGSLGHETAIAVIRFYKVAQELHDIVQRYLNYLEKAVPPQLSSAFLDAIERISSNLKIGALEACTRLCLAASAPFDLADVAVAKDLPEIMQLARSLNIPVSLPAGTERATPKPE